MNVEDGPRSLAMLPPFNVANDRAAEVPCDSTHFHKLA